MAMCTPVRPDLLKSVEELVQKAASQTDSADAMRFSQAAQNAMNAAALLTTVRKQIGAE